MGSLQEVVGGFLGGKGNYNGGENKQDGANWDLAVVTWELFIHCWSYGSFCFLWFRIFRGGGAHNRYTAESLVDFYS